jgi:hypothetical protein
MVVHDVLNVFDFGKKNNDKSKNYFNWNFYFSIVRAFLIEEQRIVAMVMKSKKGTAPTETVAPTPQASQKSK